MTKIENELQYNWAVAKVEELLPLVNDSTPESDPNYIELVLLSNLVADYSDEHFSIGVPSVIEMIKLRMFEKGLTQVALSRLLGINTARISEYLTGKREFTLKHARIISEKLNIDPAVVLGVSVAN